MGQTAKFFHDCRQPATCTNGKCVATGQCIDRKLDALETQHPAIEAPPLAADSFPVFAGHPERIIVAFTGLAGSGKSTAARRLVEGHGYERIRFAGPLKAMLAALGCTPAEIDGDRKEVPCDLLCGKTPRQAQQWLGTEWGRDMIGPDVWIRAWRAAVERTLPGSCIVVDDCRFPNEAAAIKALGGLIIHIDRPGAGAGAAGHSSEGQALPSDRQIANVGTEAFLFAMVDELARDMTWVAAGTH
jgi:hypothetical protein